MTCEELKTQIDDLTAQSDTLIDDRDEKRGQINTAYNNALPADIYGGTYPSVPIQLSGLQARLAYLMTRMPPPNNLISVYNGIIHQLEDLQGVQDSLDQTNQMLGSMKSQYTDKQCQPPL